MIRRNLLTTKTNNNGIYLSLVSQLDKLARHNRQGSFRTKERYYLATNAELGIELERRRFGDTDRTWSNAEFNRMLAKAMVSEKNDFILAFYLARYAGLRIHECFTGLTPLSPNRCFVKAL